MLLIGDIHGHYRAYLDLLNEFRPDFSVQLGDFGFGFGNDIKHIPDNAYFIRGNHDDPAKCKKHPNYLGDYGMHENGFFFVGGASSIDYKHRKMWDIIHGGKTWWKDEEIALEEYHKIFNLYSRSKPDIVLSHDCPKNIMEIMKSGKSRLFSRTSDQLLVKMLAMHKPKIWVFGHHHNSWDKTIKDTRFKCLKELEPFTLEI